MTFYRRVSPTEVTYAGADTDSFSPFVNQFLIEGKGTLDEGRWRDAAAKVAEANPGSRLIMRGFWGFKFWDDQGPPPKVETLQTDWDGYSSEGVPVSGRPIDPRKGPTAEVILIEAHKPLVMFRTHHGITDGKGMVHWMQEMFRALRNEPLLGSAGKYNEWDIAKTVDYPPRDIVEGKCIPVTPPSANPTLQGCRWQRLTFPGKPNKVLPRFIVAICNVARDNNSENGKIIFRIPSDLRRYAEKDKGFSMANVTGSIDLEITPEMNVNDVQKAIVRAMRNKADLSVFPRNMYLARWVPMSLFRFRPDVYQRRHENVNYRMTGIISYLGEVDLADYSDGDFEATGFYGIPIPLEDRAITIGFTFNEANGLDAVLSVPNALADKEQLAALCEQIRQELAE